LGWLHGWLERRLLLLLLLALHLLKQGLQGRKLRGSGRLAWRC
jgi:hypothetical protein